MARRMHKSGDAPAAARSAKKALHLDPSCLPRARASGPDSSGGRPARAGDFVSKAAQRIPRGALGQLQPGSGPPRAGPTRGARKNFQDFLRRRGPLPGKHGKRIGSTPARCARAWRTKPPRRWPLRRSRPGPPAIQPAAPATRTGAFACARLGRVPATAAPVFTMGSDGRTATVADYLLRRRLLELGSRRASKTSSACRSLHGVDSYFTSRRRCGRAPALQRTALLADEVGLGKTIEACLVLKEYWMRGMVRKALVLTPPSLVSQWKGELTEKFGLDAAIARMTRSSAPSPHDFGASSRWWWPPSPWRAWTARLRAGRHCLGHGDRGRSALPEEPDQRQLEALNSLNRSSS